MGRNAVRVERIALQQRRPLQLLENWPTHDEEVLEMNRRSLFGMFALSPLMAVSAFAKEEKPDGAPPESSVNLTLMGTSVQKNKNELMYLSNGPANLTFPQSDPTKSVAMAVGHDGQLWLKSKGKEWKRVVTE